MLNDWVLLGVPDWLGELVRVVDCVTLLVSDWVILGDKDWDADWLSLGV